MKKILIIGLCIAICQVINVSCNSSNPEASKPLTSATNTSNNNDLAEIFQNYYDKRMEFFPLEATANGDNRYNDQLPNDGTLEFRNRIQNFYEHFINQVGKIDRSSLNQNDQLSYDIFIYDLKTNLEALKYPTWQIPFNQFNGLPQTIGQAASGDNVQPFKTKTDYENWLKRLNAFNTWVDTAIVNFKTGIKNKNVLPKAIVSKMIPICTDLVNDTITKSIFYLPIKNIPATFSEQDKQRFDQEYQKIISKVINPAYTRLANFLKTEYLPKARNTSGINDSPNGGEYYQYAIKSWTTTNMTPDEIYKLGEQEVARISSEMEKIKQQVGFKGNLQDFFKFMQTDPQFFPYKTPQNVLDAFNNIYGIIQPNLQKMFGKTPKSKFEIRQTEKFREATASAEYLSGTPDGTRPGIFYVPIPDATKFNKTSGMESLFLHEAIPGHHYQSSLQNENETLPKFRRFLWYGAYGEGWALYCESLGKELGLYTDPYQYMGALGDEMHRAVRLVVDVALHTGKINREEAIAYMMKNESINLEGATAEIERYMAWPAQALSYKVGSLKIRELRTKYETTLGNNFNLAAFHDELLKDGVLPISLLETKMEDWAKKQSKN